MQSSRSDGVGNSTTPGGAVPLDMRAVFEAALAISSEILLDRLLKTLLRTVIDNAGAQKGLVFLLREGELVVAAEGHVEDGQVQASLQSAWRASAAQASIIERVRTSREAVVTGDVLCLPIQRRGALIGLLYLESKPAAQAFTRERLATLELLASQAAISLANAQLHAELK